MTEFEHKLQQEAENFAPMPRKELESKVFGTLSRRKRTRQICRSVEAAAVILLLVLQFAGPIIHPSLEPLMPEKMIATESTTPTPKVEESIQRAIETKIDNSAPIKINNKVIMTAATSSAKPASPQSEKLFKALGLSSVDANKSNSAQQIELGQLALKIPEPLTKTEAPKPSTPIEKTYNNSQKQFIDRDIVDQNIRYADNRKRGNGFKFNGLGVDLLSGVSTSAGADRSLKTAMLTATPYATGEYNLSSAQRQAGVGLSGGVSASFKISRRFSLNTGLFFSRYSEQYRVNSTALNLMGVAGTPGTAAPTRTSSNYTSSMNMLEVPVSIGLALNPESKLVVMINLGGQYSYRINNGTMPQGLSNPDYVNHHLFSVISGVNMDIPLWQNNSIIVGPEARYFITNTYSGSNGLNSNKVFFGIRTGFNFGF